MAPPDMKLGLYFTFQKNAGVKIKRLIFSIFPIIVLLMQQYMLLTRARETLW